MHISDGVLPGQICVLAYAITGGVTWFTLRRINRTSVPHEEMPKAAMLTAAFFVGSSLPIPIPPVSVHLVLNGLLGALLGWYAWPAIVVGLLLQALLLGHGGLTTLGLNALQIGLPALVAFGFFELRHRLLRGVSDSIRFKLFAFISGMLGLGLSVFLLMLAFLAGFEVASEQQPIMLILLAHIPLMLIEGYFTLMLASFLRRIKPEIVEG